MTMVEYPNCSYCGNESTSTSIVDVEVNGIRLKGIKCNHCGNYLALFKDYDSALDSLEDTIEELVSRIDDLE